jgi:hypothetical protein
MNIFTGLLFQQGYIQDPKLALSLADETPPQRQAGHGPCESVGRPKAGGRRRHPAWRHGAISAVCCSTALSPFR